MKKKFLFSATLVALALPLALSQRFEGNHAQNILDALDVKGAVANSVKINEQIANEGIILLKNDGFLPLKNVKKITIASKGAFDTLGVTAPGSSYIDNMVCIEEAFKKSGFEVNQKLMDFYGHRSRKSWSNNSESGPGRALGNDGWRGNTQHQVGETPLSSYTPELLKSMDEYKDAAILVISRTSVEGCDLNLIDERDYDPSFNNVKVEPNGLSQRHALQLSKNEEDLLGELHKHFDHIIVALNTPSAFECEQLQNDSKVSGIVWMGRPGVNGLTSFVNILTGKVNPSGRTVDTWGRDFKEDPTYQNYSTNSQTNDKKMDHVYNSGRTKNSYAPQDTMFNADGSPVMSFGSDKKYNNHNEPRYENEDAKVVQGGINGVRPSAYVTFEEDIYRDYRYYETKYADMAAKDKKAADEWYDSNKGVLYPFGYGLSYTSFESTIAYSNYKNKSNLTAETKNIEIDVKVKNTGHVAGKEVIQAYFKAPYIKGGIEKPYETLCAFAKTELLEPGKSQIVRLSFNLQDVASYDYQDKNNNGFKGYELDAGTYYISINKNAHESIGQIQLNLNEGIKYENDRFSGNKVENRFSNNDFDSSLPLANDIGYTLMSRENMDSTFPVHPTMADRTLKAGSKVEEYLTHEFNIAELEVLKNDYSLPKEVIVTKEQAVAAGWAQETSATAEAAIKIDEMRGLSLDDPKWDKLLNQLTFAELLNSSYRFGSTSRGVIKINKKLSPINITGECVRNIGFASNMVLASTYNVELAQKEAECFATECVFGNFAFHSALNVATRRSPFAGKSESYFSSDPLLNGKMAAKYVKTCYEKGVIVSVIEFGGFGQEKNREGGIAYKSEQTLRELDLKPYQIVVEEGQAIGVTTAFNRLGLRQVDSSYALLTKVLREEWGFKGYVVTHMNHSGNESFNSRCYECLDYNIIAGADCFVDSASFSVDQIRWDSTVQAPQFEYNGTKYTSYTWWGALRRAAKEEMYAYANSFLTLNEAVASTEDIEISGDTNGRVGEEMNITVNNKNNALTLAIDNDTPLPAGLKFENNAIVGTPTKEGSYAINFLLKSGEETKSGKVVRLEIAAAKEGNNKEGKKGCFGELNGSFIAISLVGLSAIALIIAKRRKEHLA